jgi:hypothetical protein
VPLRLRWPGAFASILVYPLETARTRLALGAAHGNFVRALAGVVRAEGFPALYKVRGDARRFVQYLVAVCFCVVVVWCGVDPPLSYCCESYCP